MELISLKFALFLVASLTTYYVAGRLVPKLQWVVLLASSMAFYKLVGSWKTLALMVAVALVTWLAALGLHALDQACAKARKTTKDRTAKKALRQRFLVRKRVVLIAALAVCLGILGYFKYWNVLLFYVGKAPDTFSLGILLPLGISFYTFQVVGYLIDAYNQKYAPERNFARYLLFVSWFPQIIQGPINRFDQLSHQLMEPHGPGGTHVEHGLLRLGYGMLKKIAIANVLSNAVWAIFHGAAGPAIPGSLALYGVLVYSIQMYADFSGGIDIVEGISELFGIQMAQNFRQPYFSVSLADFWRRWHMSLGAWMRDYVFYPLAVTSGSRRFGKWAGKHFGKHAGRTLPACVANIIVFLLVGLWHGAEAHYLVWGLYNGVIVALSDLCKPLFDKLVEVMHVRRESAGFHLFGIVRTFAVVCVGRYFDCFDHVSDAFFAMRNAVMGLDWEPVSSALASAGAIYASGWGFTVPTLLACAFVLVVDVFYERGTNVRDAVLAWRLPLRVALYAALIVLVASAAALDTTGGGGGFLYANF
ncbi:MAG: MBOAT family O-acyltransferase [Coriobacteriales bacterium]|nr:MBOAT family O-acyltransferase [Coriobacteriales bacterium]